MIANKTALKKLNNISFWMNLSALSLIILGYFFHNKTLKTVGLYAFSGAITNLLAIVMLFEKIPFIYGSGVIAAKFDVFKLKIKQMIMNTFFQEDRVAEFIKDNLDIELVKKLPWNDWCEELNYDELYSQLTGAVLSSKLGGMLGMFGGESALDSMKPKVVTSFKDGLKNMLHEDEFQEKISQGFKDTLLANKFFADKIELLIDTQLEELTPKMVKDLVHQMINEHLGYLVLWGGIFGGLIGFVSSILN